MSYDLNDTIVALSSAAGPGARAVVRLSGPDAFRIASDLLTPAGPLAFNRRRLYPGHVRLPDVPSPLPAEMIVFPAPHTYTGQHIAELHTVGCPPLVELLIAELLKAGARAARPGEFTLRAFLAGKLDLTRAEAVLGVIEAGSRDELKQALAQLAGGVARPLQELRGDLLDLLADLEAGLDFADEDIQFVSADEQLRRLGRALALLTLLGKQLDQRALGGRAFRVVLAGRPNAGKSSLFNALTGGSALVSPEPGTTRDYLVRRLDLDGVPVELIDTAGWREASGDIEEQALALGREQAHAADLVLLCVEAGREPDAAERQRLAGSAPPAVGVATKCDLARPSFGDVATSAATGAGLGALRALLAGRAKARAQPALAPSVSRCRHHVAACLERLREAHQMVLYGEGPELVALELRGALDELGEMVGAVYTDDLLDRIFSRFCIGK
jgi:tRNA modification GTPase